MKNSIKKVKDWKGQAMPKSQQKSIKGGVIGIADVPQI